jgi:DNA-binding GntR family transcriptional regulator
MHIDGGRRKRQSRRQPVADPSEGPHPDETIEPERSSSTDHVSLSAKHADRGERPLVVYLQLRNLIVRGTIAPGTPLLETELADRLSVSRTPIRGALQRLRQEGLIADASGRRVFKFVVAPLTRDDARSLFHIMGELEGLAAHAASMLPNTERTVLSEALTRVNGELLALAQTTEPHSEQFFELDREFHRLTTGAGSNPRLTALRETIEPQVERYWRAYAVMRADAVGSSAGEHDDIIKAIARGDADAAHHAVRMNWRNSADRLTPAFVRLGERGRW